MPGSSALPLHCGRLTRLHPFPHSAICDRVCTRNRSLTFPLNSSAAATVSAVDRRGRCFLPTLSMPRRHRLNRRRRRRSPTDPRCRSESMSCRELHHAQRVLRVPWVVPHVEAGRPQFSSRGRSCSRRGGGRSGRGRRGVKAPSRGGDDRGLVHCWLVVVGRQSGRRFESPSHDQSSRPIDFGLAEVRRRLR